MLPRLSCPRCQTALATNQLLTAHLKMATPCTVHDGEPLEGVSPDVERELRKRNRSTTEEKKWLDMYQLLFSDDDAATYPTPCESRPDIDIFTPYHHTIYEFFHIVARLNHTHPWG